MEFDREKLRDLTWVKPEHISAFIKSNHLKAVDHDMTKSKGRHYPIIQDIAVVATDEIVAGLYACSRCPATFVKDAAVGTNPLWRHVERLHIGKNIFFSKYF